MRRTHCRQLTTTKQLPSSKSHNPGSCRGLGNPSASSKHILLHRKLRQVFYTKTSESAILNNNCKFRRGMAAGDSSLLPAPQQYRLVHRQAKVAAGITATEGRDTIHTQQTKRRQNPETPLRVLLNASNPRPTSAEWDTTTNTKYVYTRRKSDCCVCCRMLSASRQLTATRN